MFEPCKIVKPLVGSTHFRDWLPDGADRDPHGYNQSCVRIHYDTETGCPQDLLVLVGGEIVAAVYCRRDGSGVFASGSLGDDPREEDTSRFVDTIERCFRYGSRVEQLLFRLCVLYPRLAYALNQLYFSVGREVARV